MKKSLKIVAASAACAVLGMSAAAAADMEGPYLGAALLRSHFDSSKFSFDDIDSHDTSWKVLGGLRLTPNFAVEAAYTKFGREQAPSVNTGDSPFEARAKAFSAFGVGLWPIGPVDLFVKAGAARIKTTNNSDVPAVYYKDNDTTFAYGGGVQMGFGRVALRAEYEKFDTKVIGDLDIISLGVTFSFGAT